jgi:hypothetical protein
MVGGVSSRRSLVRAVTATACAALAALVAPLGGTAAPAAPTVVVPVQGAEVWASDTVGRFAGTASEPAPGAWRTTVVHTPLHGHAEITGGTWTLVAWVRGDARRVRGTFTAGTVDVTDVGRGCTDERFAVVALGRTAHVDVTLTHYRRRVLGRCVIYSASVDGTLTIAESALRRGIRARAGDLLEQGAGWVRDRLPF